MTRHNDTSAWLVQKQGKDQPVTRFLLLQRGAHSPITRDLADSKQHGKVASFVISFQFAKNNFNSCLQLSESNANFSENKS